MCREISRCNKIHKVTLYIEKLYRNLLYRICVVKGVLGVFFFKQNIVIRMEFRFYFVSYGYKFKLVLGIFLTPTQGDLVYLGKMNTSRNFIFLYAIRLAILYAFACKINLIL